MSIRPILRMGDPRLLQSAREVSPEFLASPGFSQLLADLRDTMHDAQGAGLAAPQIGEDWQVVIFGSGELNPRYPDAPIVPLTVLINPRITPLSNDLEEGLEGCLSVPGLRGMVPRYTHIRYEGLDETGQTICREVSGFHARVVQHECDHLWGQLYLMRVRDFRHFGFLEELAARAL